MLDGEIDTDIKTVADSDLPRPGDPERISVRILSKKRPVELEVDSQTKVVVSGEHVTIGKDQSKKPIADVKKSSSDDKKSEKSKKKDGQKNRKTIKKTDKKPKDEKKES